VKSGRPGRWLCRRQPHTRAARKAASMRSSVDRLPRGLILRIISERFAREKTSAIPAMLRDVLRKGHSFVFSYGLGGIGGPRLTALGQP